MSFDAMYALLEAGADFRAADPQGFNVAQHFLDGKVQDPKSTLVKSRQRCIESWRKRD